MTGPSDPAGSKGMRMIASYRAERLSQRPVLRTSLRHSHAGMRAERAAAPAAPAEPATSPAAAGVPPIEEPGLAASVFAGLFTQAEARQLAETVAAPEPVMPTPEPIPSEPARSTEAATEEIPAPTEHAAEEATAPSEPAVLFDPPLAEIGFGPGMLIRLSQIGLNTTGDMAQVSPGHLRAALGDISRLVDVESWISNARARMTRPGDPMP